MNKSGGIMTSGKHPVVINLSWPTKEHITLKKQTLMFCHVLKHANFPWVALYIFKKCWWQGCFKCSANVLSWKYFFCGDLKMLTALVPISKHPWISWIDKLQNLICGTFILVGRKVGWNTVLGTFNFYDLQQIF